jgi:16S rRNA (guanine966-N2)-methyltransferase
MRVIAGTLGGRKLQVPRGRETRPTSDRVREALFSILGDITDRHVLDLYAGSGALAIEALSRGAASATLVDSGRAAVDAITDNLNRLGIDAEVVAADALRFCERASREAQRANTIWCSSTLHIVTPASSDGS